MDGYIVSVDRHIAAAPDALFAIVADATRHPEIDGSGSVVQAKRGAPQQLTMGASFGMSMKAGLPYSMSNTVIEFEPNRRIAWQTVFAGPLGRFLGGRVWRYTFEPVDGGTVVTESWDISKDRQRAILKRVGPLVKETSEAMNKTLEKLATLTES